MVKIIILFGSLFVFECFANDAKVGKKSNVQNLAEPEFLISETYRNGAYLIYDCKERHFACVNEESYKLCQDNRKKSFIRKHSHHRCAPLKKFDQQANCFKVQMNLIEKNPDKRFCINLDRKLLN